MKLKFILCLAGILLSNLSFAEEKLNDAQIVLITRVTNSVQLKGSRYVHPRTAQFEVKNFSNTMMIDYNNYENVILDFIYKYQIVPEESEESKSVAERGKEALATLEKLSGTELEKKYIDYEVELHEKTLETIDKLFLPNVTIPELRHLVNNIRPNIINRLEWALRIKAAYERY